ncbi:MAG: hypothetical protein AB7G06_00030 [Bdellovibrionales bacterium]
MSAKPLPVYIGKTPPATPAGGRLLRLKMLKKLRTEGGANSDERILFLFRMHAQTLADQGFTPETCTLHVEFIDWVPYEMQSMLPALHDSGHEIFGGNAIRAYLKDKEKSGAPVIEKDAPLILTLEP